MLVRTSVAHITVSFKRFVDNVALAIDRDLVRGIAKGIRGLLRKKLISGDPLKSNGTDRCKELLMEHPAVVSRRIYLERMYYRLNAANRELMQIFSVQEGER